MRDAQPMRILTADSVDELRVRARTEAQRIWDSSLDELVDAYDLKMVDSEYLITPGIGLRMKDDSLTYRELDAENSEQLLNLLPTLTMADAVDERLWVTLALGLFGDYTRDRWPLAGVDVSRHLSNHVFASTDRKRERDQSIARLWWSGQYVRRFAGNSLNLSLQAFFANSDLPVQLLGRPNLASVGSIARPILQVFEKYLLDDQIKYSRGGVRKFLEGVDFLAGRRALGVLSDDEVLGLLEPSFRAHFGIDVS